MVARTRLFYFSFNSESGSAAIRNKPDYDDAGFYPLNIMLLTKRVPLTRFRLITVDDYNNSPVIDFAQFLSSDDTTIYKFAGDTVIFDVMLLIQTLQSLATRLILKF